MKIPFSIKYRPQIESGEYKVETRNGYPARIICWDRKAVVKQPLIALIEGWGGETVIYTTVTGKHVEETFDLFIVTPEEEMTPFEKGFLERVFHQKVEDLDEQNKEIFLEDARYVLGLAREQFIKDGYVIEKKAFHDAVENIDDKHKAEMSVEYSLHCKVENGTRHAVINWNEFQKVAQHFIDCGKAEALRTRATELTKNLVKSGLDKDSIPYHLVEFMCNLYTCQNWKEIEETAELYVTRIKAAALKDLPRWRKWGNGAAGNSDGHPIALVSGAGGIRFVSVLGVTGEKYIMLDDLKKLPGFKEDSHE